MALQMPVTTEYGVTANYLNIAGVVNDFAAKRTQVALAAFVNQDARQAGAKPLGTSTINLDGDDFGGDKTRAELYAILKAKPEFATSVDC